VRRDIGSRVLGEAIQPFPSFSDAFTDALKALRRESAGAQVMPLA
jgi:hypothetical protein